MAHQLQETIVKLILENIEAGAIDRKAVRQIIVGLSRNGQSINIWQQEKWDDYNEYRDEQAIAEIDISDWLDLLDTIGFSDAALPSDGIEPSPYLPRLGILFVDSAMQTRYEKLLTARINEITAALKAIATGQLLGEFGKLVGLRGLRISNSGYADLVCLYHPRGVDIFPASERRLPGFSSIYGWMSFPEDGLIHFYTEGEAEDKADEADDEASAGDAKMLRHYLFSEMDCFHIDDGEVVFQLTASGQQIEFDHGHTHEEWGGPDQAAVNQRLVDHFMTRAPRLFFDPGNAPAPEDREAWDRWLALYEKAGDKHPAGVVSNALEDGDLRRAEAFLLTRKFTDKELSDLRGDYLEYYERRKEYAALIDLFRGLDPESKKNRGWKCYYRALLMLGKTAEAYEETAVGLKKAKADGNAYTVHAAFLTIAGVNLGKKGKYADVLAKAKELHDMDIYCAALALVQGDEPEQYTSALAGAVRDNKYLPEYAECDFRAAPKVLAVAGSDLVILGSGTLVSQLTKERLIDEYQIVVVPVALGGGRTLFDGCKGRLSLKLKTSRAFANGNVVLCYEPQG
jgi:hypothetical protein